MERFSNKNIGAAITASFCTFSKIIKPLQCLVDEGAALTPILSFHAANTDTRFGTAKDFKEKLLEVTQHDIIETIPDAEPIGPKGLLDLIIVAPCTGNTLAKLCLGITDTPVTMACKAHLRNERPILIAISTNDGLSANAINLGKLMNTKGFYFVPFHQDDCQNKKSSLVADMNRIPEAAEAALRGEQLQPVLF